MAWRQHAGRAVGGEHRRAEPLRESPHGSAASRAPAADPQQRPLARRRAAPPRAAMSGARGARRSPARRRGRRAPRPPAGRSRPPGTPAASAPSTADATAAAAAEATASASSATWVDFTTGANIAAWPSVSCSTPRYSPGRRSVDGMSVAITRIGDRDAHASPTAPERVRRARPGRGQRHAQPARRARVPVGGVGGRLLVADADEPDRRLAQRLPEREVVHAGQPEADLHACPPAARRR